MEREKARRRAAELVNKMTLEERAGQLRYNAPAIPRLNIPAYNWWNEGLHGVARAGTATVFPQAIGMAAAFDEELMKDVADCIATEGRAIFNEHSARGDRDIYKGLTFWSPNVNIFRDPRWGRGHETYGEDPYLTSRLGVAFVKGLQGDGEVMKAAACAKHFCVHSGPEGLRHEFDARPTPKDMEETYLPAFEALVKEAGVEAVMGAYNRVNGEPCCGSKTLIQDILREKWGFQGHFVSDCWAIQDFHEFHMVTSSAKESAALALNAGCDLNCGVTYLHVLNALENGLVTEEAITEAAVRLFTTRFLLGLFDGSAYDKISYHVVECKEHRELADRAAKESIVLLKNDGILPLDIRKLKTIGVIGPNADSRASLVGNYHGTSSEYITVLEGIQRYVGNKAKVLYSAGSHLYKDKTESLAWPGDRLTEAKIVAEHSDVVILCVGLDETLEGEQGDTGNSSESGDKKNLYLPDSQRKLAMAVAQTGKPAIFLLMAGSAINLSFASDRFNAVMQTWYPGARGGSSVADILFGEASPSGKLPVTFYSGELGGFPEFTDYSMKGRTYRYIEQEPQFSFGFGLTYGEVTVTKAALQEVAAEDGGGTRFRIKATAENNGAFETDDVIQVYIKNMDSPYAVRNVSLCGFKRIHLETGEERTVEIDIDQRAFTVVNEEGERLVDGKRYRFYVATFQPDERSRKLMGIDPIELDYTMDES